MTFWEPVIFFSLKFFLNHLLSLLRTSLLAQIVKNLPAMQDIGVQYLG